MDSGDNFDFTHDLENASPIIENLHFFAIFTLFLFLAKLMSCGTSVETDKQNHVGINLPKMEII